MRLIAYVGVVLGLTMAPVHAANITTEVRSSATFVRITGEIVSGDADKFKSVTANLTGDVGVVLSSGGGAVGDGLEIGATIRRKGFDTLVLNGGTCASVCGLIWLGGKNRFIAKQGRVGFHAAFSRDGNAVAVSGAANAVIGAYLSRLDLSNRAIVYLTEAPPNDIQWLQFADAQRLGIEYDILPDAAPAPAPVAIAPPPAATGNSISEWLAAGSVPAPTISPEQQAAATTAAYADGRRDRIDYEQWYSALPDGPFRYGVTFWAGNRSLKPPPSCAQPGSIPEWQAGCMAAFGRLGRVDVRRHSEVKTTGMAGIASRKVLPC